MLRAVCFDVFGRDDRAGDEGSCVVSRSGCCVTLGPLCAPAETTEEAGAPGIILLGQDLDLMSMNPEAARWLAEIDAADWPGSTELPMAVYAAAARLARLEQGPALAPQQLADTIRLTTPASSCPGVDGVRSRPARSVQVEGQAISVGTNPDA